MANYADHFNNLSGNYYDITTNYIKENPDERAHLWSILLNYLHNTIGLTEGQIAYNTTQVFHIINRYCDFPDEAFTGLIVSLTEDLNNNDWLYINVPHWNESWNTALETFIKSVCPTYMVDGEPYDPKAMYENSCPIYVDEEGGLIAPDIIRGSLTNSYIVPLRVKDMKEADAGANFVTVDQLYSHTEVAAGIDSDVDITFEFKRMDKVEEYFSKLDEADSSDDAAAIKDQYFKDCADVRTEYDHYKNGEPSYFKYTETADNIRLIYKNWSTYEDLFDKPISDNYAAFLNDVRYYAKDNIWDYWTNRFNTIDDRYSITVHCETEPRKFYSLIAPWVIPWYNINGKSYSQVRGADKLVSVLANEKRLQFTQDDEDQKWIRLIMPKNTRRVEIEDLNRNFWVIAQVITGIGTYLFDPNGPIPLIIRTSIQEIADMWENVENLWGAICALGQKPHVTDVRTMVVPLTSSELQPFLKYDNFDNINSYATMRAACEARLNYLKSQYSNSHLIVIPEIRLNNYEKNYYSRVCYPGIMKLNRNVEPLAWTWQNISQSETAYDIDLSDVTIASHKSHTYGLRESSEETYNYYVPLSKSVSEADGKRYYELLRPSYVVGGTYNNQQNTLTGSVSITYWDAARQAAVGNTVKVWENGQWLNPSVSKSGIVTVPITRGYYQGELLSTYKESESISHLAKVIYVELEPEALTSAQAREKDPVRIQDANNVLQYYFTNALFKSDSYNPDQLYILIGHFYYANIEGSGLEYWTTSGKVPSEHSHYKAGNQGVDVGTVVYLPGKHNAPIVYGGVGAYWAYSIYDSSEWSGSTGAASYRFELYTKNGRITDDTSSWYLKMISIASLRAYNSSTTKPVPAPTSPSPSNHYFVHSGYQDASYTEEGVTKYRTYLYTNRRIFIYELDGTGNIRERKWEREDLANDFSYTMKGSITFNPSKYPYKSVQDLGSSHAGQMQILKVNTNYGNNYPEYENYRNNGYTE